MGGRDVMREVAMVGKQEARVLRNGFEEPVMPVADVTVRVQGGEFEGRPLVTVSWFDPNSGFDTEMPDVVLDQVGPITVDVCCVHHGQRVYLGRLAKVGTCADVELARIALALVCDSAVPGRQVARATVSEGCVAVDISGCGSCRTGA